MGGSVSCRCEVDDRGAGFPRAPEAPKLGSLCGVFLISDEAGAGPLPSTRIHADGLNPGPLSATRMASPTPSPSPSLIKIRNTKTPNFGVSAGRGNSAPLTSSSHPQPTPGPAVGPFLLFLDVEGEPVGAKVQKGLNRIVNLLGVFYESAEGAGSCCHNVVTRLSTHPTRRQCEQATGVGQSSLTTCTRTVIVSHRDHCAVTVSQHRGEYTAQRLISL